MAEFQIKVIKLRYNNGIMIIIHDFTFQLKV
jgi:hypothetical protein